MVQIRPFVLKVVVDRNGSECIERVDVSEVKVYCSFVRVRECTRSTDGRRLNTMKKLNMSRILRVQEICVKAQI